MRELTPEEQQLALEAFRLGWAAHLDRYSRHDPSLQYAERHFIHNLQIDNSR